MGARRDHVSPGTRWLRGLMAAAIGLTLASCSAPLGDYHDKAADLTKEDFENVIGSTNLTVQPQPVPEVPPIPDLVPTLVAPVPPAESGQQLVSISVTETVPVRSVLLELARAAEVDLELDPAIEGGVIFTARNKPFIDVVERLANMANLRYTFKNGVLAVELDRPYHRNYRVDQLAVARAATGQIDISTDVFTSVGDSSAGANGSQANISQTANSDFYAELETNIEQILINSAPALEVNELQLASVESVAVEGAEVDAVATTTVATSGLFSVHRQGGLISVYATERQHRLIQDYLIELMEQVASQVLIEAKVLEVNLNDEFRSGIQWDVVADLLGGAVEAGLTTGTSLFTDASDAFTGTYTGTDVEGVISLISEFGTTRTLANPRVAISNNQAAVLKVAQNQVYFTIELEEETTEFGTTQTFTSTLNTVPVGLVMVVQPSIDIDTDTVTLSLRPTLSRIIGFVDDPAVSLASDNTVTSQVPVTEVREIDSVVSAHSGEVVIMGGLMQEVGANAEAGIPGFQDIPWLGNAFKSNDDRRDVVELVIFLRATIVPAPVPDPADIDLYSTFALDPRPLTF